MVDFVLLRFAGCKSALSSLWKFPSMNILIKNNPVYLPGFFFWWDRQRKPLIVSCFLQPESHFEVYLLCSSHFSALFKDFSTGIYVGTCNTRAVYSGIYVFSHHFFWSNIKVVLFILVLLWSSHWVPCSSFESLLSMIWFRQFTGGPCILISSHLALNSGMLKVLRFCDTILARRLDHNKSSVIIFTYDWNCYIFNSFFRLIFYFLISVSPVLFWGVSLIFLISCAACHVLTRSSIVKFNVFWNIFTYTDKNRDMFSSTFFWNRDR